MRVEENIVFAEVSDPVRLAFADTSAVTAAVSTYQKRERARERARNWGKERKAARREQRNGVYVRWQGQEVTEGNGRGDSVKQGVDE